MIVVDSNVLLDVIQAQPEWLGWSRAELGHWVARGPLIVNDVVYAELSVAFETTRQLDAFLAAAGVSVQRSPAEALFLAARAHLEYRRRGGARTGVLADFFIGADAAVRQMPLLTRDPRRYRRYFPTVRLISPS